MHLEPSKANILVEVPQRLVVLQTRQVPKFWRHIINQIIEDHILPVPRPLQLLRLSDKGKTRKNVHPPVFDLLWVGNGFATTFFLPHPHLCLRE